MINILVRNFASVSKRRLRTSKDWLKMHEDSQKSICYVFYRPEPETNLEHLSKAVSDSGYDVTILARLEPSQEIFELLDRRKIYRIPLPGGKRGKRKRMLSFILKSVDFLNKHDFSIVHIHSSCAYFSLVKILTSNRAEFIYHKRVILYQIRTLKRSGECFFSFFNLSSWTR